MQCVPAFPPSQVSTNPPMPARTRRPGAQTLASWGRCPLEHRDATAQGTWVSFNEWPMYANVINACSLKRPMHVPRRLCKVWSESTIGMIASCRSAVIQDRQMSFVYQLAQQKKAHHNLSHMTLLRCFLPVGKPLVLQAGRLRFAAGTFATPSSSSNGKGWCAKGQEAIPKEGIWIDSAWRLVMDKLEVCKIKHANTGKHMWNI